MAGGTLPQFAGPGEAKYYPNAVAKQGDLGSKVRAKNPLRAYMINRRFPIAGSKLTYNKDILFFYSFSCSIPAAGVEEGPHNSKLECRASGRGCMGNSLQSWWCKLCGRKKKTVPVSLVAVLPGKQFLLKHILRTFYSLCSAVVRIGCAHVFCGHACIAQALRADADESLWSSLLSLTFHDRTIAGGFFCCCCELVTTGLPVSSLSSNGRAHGGVLPASSTRVRWSSAAPVV